MPIIYEDALKRDVKNSDFAPVYILFGEDAYLKKHYCDAVIKKVCKGTEDFNYQSFGNGTDLQLVYDAVNQFPMMAEKKCVLLADYDFEHAEKSEYDRLCALLSDVPDTCVLILKFDAIPFDLKGSSKSKRIVACAEKSGGKAVDLGHRNESELTSMLIRGAQKRGCVLSSAAAKELVRTAGDDINILTFELDKLCLYKGGGDIEKSDIQDVSAKTVEASVYDYVKEIFNCNITGALSLLDDMFFMQFEPMIILYTVSAAFVDIYRVFAAERADVSRATLAEDFGYTKKMFVLDRARQNLKKLDGRKLKAAFDALMQADRALKTAGADPKVILEELTVKLGVIISSSGGDDFC